MFRKVLTIFAIVYICWYTTSIPLLSLNKYNEKEGKLKREVLSQKETEFDKRLQEDRKVKYYRFLVQFTKPINTKDISLPFKQWWFNIGVNNNLLGDVDSPVYEISIGSETMSQEQVREALLNWKLVVRVFTYREMYNNTFPHVE